MHYIKSFMKMWFNKSVWLYVIYKGSHATTYFLQLE